MYLLASKSYELLTEDRGNNPRWLSDSRRALYVAANRLMLVDSASRRTRELLALDAGTTLSLPGVARDGSRLVLLRKTWDSDIWLATIGR